MSGLRCQVIRFRVVLVLNVSETVIETNTATAADFGRVPWDTQQLIMVACFQNIFKLIYLMYRGTSLTRERAPLGPYRRPMSRVLGES